MHLPERARSIWAWIVGRQPWSILGPLLAVQWLALLAFAASVQHNGWLYYQGGDQTYYWTGAHLLSNWTLPVTAIGYGWSYLLTPIALIAGADVLSGLPTVILLDTLVLLPVALLCMYGIGARIGGRVLGYWAAFLWVLLPYAAMPMWDPRYHSRYIDIALPQQFGLTPLGDFPSMVCLLVTAYLLVRAMDGGDWRDAVLAGVVGAFALGIKPSNALFFGAAVLSLVAARRWSQVGIFLASMLPGVVVLAIWKQRGLGELPAFSSYSGPNGRVAATGVDVPVASITSPIEKYVNLDWHQLYLNMDGLREFFWAVRPLEFIVFAGAIAIGRRSWPKTILIFGWFMTFFILKGTDEKANVADTSIFRLLMPSFPAFVLLLAAIPLLLPTFGLTRRLFPAAPPIRWRPGNRALGTVAGLLVVLPLILVASTPAQSTPEAVSYPAQNVYVPVTNAFDLRVAGNGRAQQLTWKAPHGGRTKVYYTVLRSPYTAPDSTSSGDRKAVEGIACKDHQPGALQCNLLMDRLAGQFGRKYTDRPRPGKWTYRIGMSANWENDPNLGDIIMLSKPVTVTVR